MNQEKKNQRIISIALLAIVISSLIGLYMFMKVIPDYEFQYLIFDTQIPVLTRICITISDLVRRFFVLLFPIYLIVLATFMVLPFIIKNKSILAKIYSIVASLFILFVVIGDFAVKMPLIQVKKNLMQYKNITLKEANKEIDKIVKEEYR